MSHFTVAVFHKEDQSIEELLDPYEEVISIDPRDSHSKKRAIQFARRHYDDCKNCTEITCMKKIVARNKPEKDGIIYLSNPEGKWDWWTIGGRWNKLLTIKSSEEKVDSARVSDIDFSPNPNFYNDALVEWDAVVEGKTVDGLPPDPFVDKDELIKIYKTRDTYATVYACFHTYAVITPDGKWHAQGRMGWFGMDSASAEEERDWRTHYKEHFIDTADPEWILTIVDCHI